MMVGILLRDEYLFDFSAAIRSVSTTITTMTG